MMLPFADFEPDDGKVLHEKIDRPRMPWIQLQLPNPIGLEHVVSKQFIYVERDATLDSRQDTYGRTIQHEIAAAATKLLRAQQTVTVRCLRFPSLKV